MSKIKMAEAIKLQDTLSKKITDLLQERGRVATATIEKGEKAEDPIRSLDLITAEIREARTDLRVLKAVTRESNQRVTINWDDADLPVSYCLDLVKDIRTDAEETKNLGNRKKQDRDNGNRFGTASAVTTFTVALYEPDEYRAYSQKTFAIADKLSMLIQMSNLNTEVEYAVASKYMLV